NTLLSYNMGSHMFRRDLVDKVGGWDTTRVSSDSEFIRRISHHLGTGRPRAYPEDVPLAFGRVEAGSLTQTSATHLSSLNPGVRREYIEAITLWHERNGALPPPSSIAPRSIRQSRESMKYDALVISDFNSVDSTNSDWLLITALRDAGFRLAVFQYPNYWTLK